MLSKNKGYRGLAANAATAASAYSVNWNYSIEDEKESEEQTTTYKSKCYTIKEIIDNGYNIDLCGYPHKEEIILEPKELIEQYQEQRASLNAEIDKILAEVSKLLEEE